MTFLAQKGCEVGLIYDTTVGTEKACAGSNAYASADYVGAHGAQGGVIDLGMHRRLTIWGNVDAGAAGSIVSFAIGLSAAATPPKATTAGRWFPVSKLDDSSVNAVLAAAPGMGVEVATSLQPAWSTNTIRPMDIRIAAALNAADEIPFVIRLDVEDARWAWVRYAQGDGGAAAKVVAWFSLSSG